MILAVKATDNVGVVIDETTTCHASGLIESGDIVSPNVCLLRVLRDSIEALIFFFMFTSYHQYALVL